MTEHAVVIGGGGPTGLMLAGELALGAVTAPTAVLIRPDGYVAWGDSTQPGLADALTTWFGPP